MDSNQVLEAELKACIGELVFQSLASKVQINFANQALNQQAKEIEALKKQVEELTATVQDEETPANEAE